MSLEEAARMARSIPYVKGKKRVAAIITDRWGNVETIGLNSYCKTHPIQKRYAQRTGNADRQYLHAEISAIIQSKGNGSSIYIARVKANGEVAMAKPCPVCSLALKEANIKNIFYTEDMK